MALVPPSRPRWADLARCSAADPHSTPATNNRADPIRTPAPRPKLECRTGVSTSDRMAFPMGRPASYGPWTSTAATLATAASAAAAIRMARTSTRRSPPGQRTSSATPPMAVNTASRMMVRSVPVRIPRPRLGWRLANRCCSSAPTAVPALGAPTEKENAPCTGWVSAEMTRQLTT